VTFPENAKVALGEFNFEKVQHKSYNDRLDQIIINTSVEDKYQLDELRQDVRWRLRKKGITTPFKIKPINV
jgi:hypothetical protein